MRNLIAFISKYSFFLLFIFFEVIAFYLLFKNNNFQRSSFLNASNSVTGGVYESYSELTDYFNLKEVNLALAEENERLREKQLNSYSKLFGENIWYNDTILQRQYHYTRARVINNSINRQNNYLTLNRGSLNGIKSGMGVIGPSGVIGVVKDVSRHYATVLSILHRESRISVKLKATNYFGSMQWDGENYQKGVLFDIPNHVLINVGDTIVTSGYSATFPEGLPVATIDSFNKPEGENFYEVFVSFINDMKHVSHVYIVKNNQSIEQKELEDLSEEND